MSLLTFSELWERLLNSDETVEIEAKRAEDLGTSILETVSAFSNEPGRGGGYLLLGVGLRPNTLFPDYEVTGVPDPDRMQQELANKCHGMFSSPIRPYISVEQCGHKTVLVVYIPEAPAHAKPIYIKSKGLEKGCFRRIGSADQHCTDDDVALLYQLRDHRSFDTQVLPDTSLEDFDPTALAAYRRERAEINPDAAELGYSDEDLLDALSATAQHQGKTCTTIAGLVLFGKPTALRRHFPAARVDYIMVQGREWVEDPDERYHGVEWLEPLMTLIPRVVAHVMEDIPKAFAMAEDGVRRREIPRVPQKVIREAVVNALMHRSYRQKQPVQIIRYSNRLELRNPGHSLKPDDRLGEPGSLLRNEKIAAVLHDTPYAETKGTGIRTMRKLMADANLTAPFFESDRQADCFVATLLPHHLLSDQDFKWLASFQDCNLSGDEARALVVLREVGAMNNAYYRTLNSMDTLTASQHLQRLRDLKLLKQKGRGSATYYEPGERYLASVPGLSVSTALSGGTVDSAVSTVLSTGDRPLSTVSDTVGKVGAALPEGFPSPPELLAFALQSVGKRASPRNVKTVIRALCAWRELRSEEIAILLQRDEHYVLTNYLRPMIRDGELLYVYPDAPQHPRQAYRAPDRPDEEGAEAPPSGGQPFLPTD